MRPRLPTASTTALAFVAASCRPVPRIRQKGDCTGARPGKRSHMIHRRRRIAAQLAAVAHRQCAQRQRHGSLSRVCCFTWPIGFQGLPAALFLSLHAREDLRSHVELRLGKNYAVTNDEVVAVLLRECLHFIQRSALHLAQLLILPDVASSWNSLTRRARSRSSSRYLLSALRRSSAPITDESFSSLAWRSFSSFCFASEFALARCELILDCLA